MGKTKLWKEFDEKLDQIFRMANGRVIILWGYGQSGQFLEHVFKRRNRILDYIIDNHKQFPAKLHVYTTNILQELDNRNCFIICAFPENDEYEAVLRKYGYEEHVSYINLSKELYGENNKRVSYYDWLEHCYGVEIVDAEYVGSGNNLYYSYGSDYALMDILDNFCFTSEDAVFDFGCGKAGSLLMLHDKGIGRIGGVELNRDLYETALENLKKCGVNEFEILNSDALNIKETLDHYNYFYMYNPFLGNTFRTVINNLEESYNRNKRKIFLLYSGATLHTEVVRNGYFRLVKRIDNDFWNNYTNIYVINELK